MSMDVTLSDKTIEEVEVSTGYENLEFARNSVSYKLSTTSSNKKAKVSDILKYIEDPIKNALELQNISNYLMNTNGIYSRIVNHFGNIPCFDYILYPIKI